MALATNALTIVSAVEQALSLTPGTRIPEIERAINVASEAIERYCSRVFYRGTVTAEKHRGLGTHRLYLARTPVISVSAVTFDGDTVDTSEYELEDAEAGFLFRDSGWVNTGSMVEAAGPYYRPGSEKADYGVTYVGGYITPVQQATTAVTRTIPWDLEGACIDTAVSLFHGQGTDRNISGETLLGASVQYSGRNPGIGRTGHVIPDAALQVLDRYVRHLA